MASALVVLQLVLLALLASSVLGQLVGLGRGVSVVERSGVEGWAEAHLAHAVESASDLDLTWTDGWRCRIRGFYDGQALTSDQERVDCLYDLFTAFASVDSEHFKNDIHYATAANASCVLLCDTAQAHPFDLKVQESQAWGSVVLLSTMLLGVLVGILAINLLNF